MSKRLKGWLIVALTLVLLGAFTVSATSTYRLGERQHLADLALYALILMLELGSVTGAAIYVATKRNDIRFRAGVVIALATGVGCTGAVQSYGFLIGLPVSLIMLLLVDLIGAFWSEQESAPVPDQAEPKAQEEIDHLEAALDIPIQLDPQASAINYVYRFFNDMEELLYVGRTNNIRNRIKHHRFNKEWWDEVIEATVVTFSSLEDAQAAESIAIDTEKPKYNIHRGITIPDGTEPLAITSTEKFDPDEPLPSELRKPAAEPDVPSDGAVQKWSVPGIIEDMASKDISNPNQRYIRNNYGVGAAKANKVLEALNGQPQLQTTA